SSPSSNSGSSASRIERSLMRQRLISGRDGISNIELSSASSMIDLSARAPVPRSSASSAMASRLPGWKTSSTLSSVKNFWYCFTSAFLGSVRMRAATLGRSVGAGALEDLEQRLLHALTADVARDRGVVGLARDLVDLIDVDDSALGAADVEVRGLDQPEQDVLDVLTHVPRLGEAGGVGDRER